MKAWFVAVILLQLVALICVTNAPGQTLEHDYDRPGMNYRNFDLAEPRPELCRQACVQDSACKSFTYVKPGVQAKAARCWLKSGVANPVKSSCCVSGAKGTKEEAMSAPTPSVPGQQLPKGPLSVQKPASLAVPDAKLLSTLSSSSHRLQSFQVAASNRLKDLNQKEMQLKNTSVEKVRRDIIALHASGSRPPNKPVTVTQKCTTPEIHSVYPISVKPGYPLLIQGCGFTAGLKVIMYDPKGETLAQNSSPPNAVNLWAEKLSGTSFQVTVPSVQAGGLVPFKAPKEVYLRIWDASTKQYGPPSPKINLGFNTSVYLCMQPECRPKKIVKNGTQTLVQYGANQSTAQVFHMTDFAEQTAPDKLLIKGSGWNNWDMKGTDILAENLNLPLWFKFTEIIFSYDLFCYDKTTKNYKSCGDYPATGLGAGNSTARLEQDLSKIDGRTSLPRATVYWQTRGGISFSNGTWEKIDDVWLAYWYALFIRGPEGWGNIPF